jgi:uncharacterized protein (DUF3820 family)
LITTVRPIITKSNAADYPLPFGMYRGKTISEIAAQPYGEDYLLWAACTWDTWFVAEMICRYLGICPLRPEDAETPF